MNTKKTIYFDNPQSSRVDSRNTAPSRKQAITASQRFKIAQDKMRAENAKRIRDEKAMIANLGESEPSKSIAATNIEAKMDSSTIVLSKPEVADVEIESVKTEDVLEQASIPALKDLNLAEDAPYVSVKQDVSSVLNEYANKELSRSKTIRQVFNRGGQDKKPARKLISSFSFVASIAVFLISTHVMINGYDINRRVEAQVEQVSNTHNVASEDDDLPDETPVVDIESYKVAPDMPRFITIEKLGVKSRIVPVGVTAENVVEAPQSIFDSGWYSGSSKPGQTGATFIDGHVSGYSSSGVFGRISQLSAGDKIKVEMGNGKIYSYTVKSKETVPLKKVDMDKALSVPGGFASGLNLMTCGGDFDASTSSYKGRTIIYTVLDS